MAGNSKLRIALIELGNSHDECLYSQIKILMSSEPIHLTLIANVALKEHAKYFHNLDESVFVSIRKGFKSWIDIYRVWKLCRIRKFDKVIFNTAQGKTVSKLLLFPFQKHTQFYGILHNVRKLIASKSQQIITKKLESYFILADYFQQHIPYKCKVEVFYPIFYPEYPSVNIYKPKDEIWVCIPGQVELKRRDYRSLFESISKYGLPQNVKFILLGRYDHPHGDGAYIKEEIQALNVEENFQLWKEFVPVNEFHAYVKSCDYILPLIHEDDISGELYSYQISGAFNLAMGYQKPMLIEEAMAEKFDFPRVILYEKSELIMVLKNQSLSSAVITLPSSKYTFESQRAIYLKSLGILF